MRATLTALFHKFRHLILYGIIGSCTATLDFLIFTALTHFFSSHYIISNGISCTIGILCSFFLNRKYNFKVTDHTLRRMVIFFSIGLFGLLLSNAILYVTIDKWHWNKLTAKLASIVIVVLIQFVLNKYISFRQTHPDNSSSPDISE